MHQAIHWYETYLETNNDPELARKVSVMKMIADEGGFAEDFDEPEDLPDLPDGYDDAMIAFADADDYEQELYEQGVLPDAPNPNATGMMTFPRVHYMAEQGDERAQLLLAAIDALE